MIRLTVDQVLSLHRMMLEQTGGLAGLRDLGLLESTLEGAFQTFDGRDLYPTLQEKAAHLAYGIVKNHPFTDGNKRMGLFVMLVFLEINGLELAYTQPELVALGLGLANGSIDAAVLLEWIYRHAKGWV